MRQSWKIGEVTVTKFVDLVETMDLTQMFAAATTEAILAISWLRPHFVTPEGRGLVSVHALVVDTPTRRIMVDTCWGDNKDLRPWDAYSHRQTSFLRDLEGGGYPRESFDLVLCTHLHADHVGWNTMLVEGKWVPTFPNARYILNKTEFEHWMRPHDRPDDGLEELQKLAMRDSVKPVHDAGLIDLVAGTHRVCDEVTLVPTPGHSPGHVSVYISSGGAQAIITGDISHHPSQLVHPEWGIRQDFDFDQAIKTREAVFSEAADKPILVIGTHWAGATAGTIERSGAAYRLRFDS